MEEVVRLLRRSSEATIWLYNRDEGFISAIKTAYFEIPLSRAVEFERRERRVLLYAALACLAFGSYAEYTFHKHFGTLSFLSRRRKRE
ncbi:MAG TPA: hypothetical protein VFD58_32715 [Blastocatellia bacterium]|nr:hypothetical protein [Blastocatellia bacterium]